MLGEILLGVRPVLARMPEIPCVFWGHGRLNEYDDDDEPRVTIRPGFPGHVLFLSPCPGVRAAYPEYGFCPGFLRSSARSIPFYYFSVLYTIKSSVN